MLAIIDLNLGNLRSVIEAFALIGADATVARRGPDLEGAAAMVLPGVGAFGDGMAALHRGGFDAPLRRHAARGGAILGICLGLHLLAERGQEHGDRAGLGVLAGTVRRLEPDPPRRRVPNMGWSTLRVTSPRAWLPAGLDGAPFYFAHSYALRDTRPEDVVAVADHGGPVAALVERRGVVGAQFHPEKSQDAGLELLEAFVRRFVPQREHAAATTVVPA
jgi:glutamine amidotransferase